MDNFLRYHYNILNEIEHITLCLTDVQYCQKVEVLSGSSIGQHLRHIIEFYICLFADKDYVNYDERERNLLIEQSPLYTREVIANLKTRLFSLDLDQRIDFKQMLGNHEVFLPSSYARELIYLSEHTIHHFALIKIGLSSVCPNVEFDKNFGVAESTVKYRQSQTS
jgi:hypothetical protein